MFSLPFFILFSSLYEWGLTVRSKFDVFLISLDEFFLQQEEDEEAGILRGIYILSFVIRK